MKQTIILWTAAFVITFLAGYIGTISGERYPVTGTIGVNGYKVTYKFDKVHYGNNPYHFMLRSDVKDLEGQLLWQTNNAGPWISEKLKWQGDEFSADIPAQAAQTVINYKVKVNYQNKSYDLPDNKAVRMIFLGEIPAAIRGVIFFTLFGGLLLSVRTGLEYFNTNDKIRKLSLFTVFFFFAYLVTFPLKSTYELGVLNNRVPGFMELFDYQPVLLFLTAVAVMIGLFNFKEKKITALIGAIITILIVVFVQI